MLVLAALSFVASFLWWFVVGIANGLTDTGQGDFNPWPGVLVLDTLGLIFLIAHYWP